MSDLLAPGVQTSLIDNSFYAPGGASTVPLVFIATADHKLQPDGITPALGTYEYGVIRELNSITDLTTLYGIPRFLTDANGNPQHGDSRNEYGLEALSKFLQIGNLAYAIRANVNLDDNLNDLKALWVAETQSTARTLSALIQAYITEYNTQNNLLPIDTGYKLTVTGAEFESILSSATADLFGLYSFSSQQFQNAFLNDHSQPQAGYQDVLFNTSGGLIQLSDATGYVSTSNYGAEVQIVSGAGTQIFTLNILGSNAVTFGQLITYINSVLGSAGTAELINGFIRISSSLTGVTSAVNILVDGTSGTLPFFGSLNLFSQLDTPVAGVGAGDLNVYDSTYTVITGSYAGLYNMISTWSAGSIVPTEFTASEAEGLFVLAANTFENTKEFVQYTALGANDAARRAAIVKQLKAVINNYSATGVLHESYQFTVIAVPGYPECATDITALSQALLEEVVDIGSVPMNLPPSGPNGITTWATSPRRVNNYLISYYYPHGLTSNLDGSTILSDSSSIALRTFAYNDTNGELWFAPAGPNRGSCPQLSDIGYASGTLGLATQFVETQIETGTRGALYQTPVNVNPVSYITGRGILVMGQKTSSPVTSSLDRVNVARLTAYIRRGLRHLLFGFLFEPNDSITRNAVKYAADSFLTQFVKRRGIYDFVTICDSTNNTAQTISANELYLDCFISPEKTVEFIYIPITLVDTGISLTGMSNGTLN